MPTLACIVRCPWAYTFESPTKLTIRIARQQIGEHRGRLFQSIRIAKMAQSLKKKRKKNAKRSPPLTSAPVPVWGTGLCLKVASKAHPNFDLPSFGQGRPQSDPKGFRWGSSF